MLNALNYSEFEMFQKNLGWKFGVGVIQNGVGGDYDALTWIKTKGMRFKHIDSSLESLKCTQIFNKE